MLKLRIVAVLFTIICGIFLFSACNNVNLSEVKLASNTFTYTGEEITPVFSKIPKGCEVLVYNEKNEQTKMIDAGNYIIKVKNGGNTKILQLTVNKQTLDLNIEDKVVVYDGQKHSIDVQFNNENNIDYELDITYNSSSELPKDAGEYQVEAVLISKNYYSYANAQLTIQKANCNVNLLATNYVYSGEEFAPNIAVDCNEEYTVKCKNENNNNIIDIGNYSVEIEVESNNYYTKIEKNITIEPKEVSFQISQTRFEYSGEEINISNYIVCSDEIDFEITNIDELINAGSYEITVEPKSKNYTGTLNQVIIITKKIVELSFDERSETYTGNEISYETNNDYTYSVLYNNSLTIPVNAGEYEVDIEIIDNNFCGSAKTKLTINKQYFILLPIKTEFVYTGENIELTYNKNLNINKTITFNDEPVSSILNAGNYIVSGEIEENNYYGSFEFNITVAPKTVDIDFQTVNYEYTGNNIELDFTLSCDVNYNITILRDNEAVNSVIDIGLYSVEITVNENNYVGIKNQIIEVVITNENTKITYAINKFYENSSYKLSGNLVVGNGIYKELYEVYSYYNITNEYETYKENYSLKTYKINCESCSFFLYHELETNNYEYERNNSVNNEYDNYLTGNRESDISNLGLLPYNILRVCGFTYNSSENKYEYSLSSEELEKLSKYYSYVFNNSCVVTNCKVYVVINSDLQIENYTISLDFTYNDIVSSGSIEYNLNTNL